MLSLFYPAYYMIASFYIDSRVRGRLLPRLRRPGSPVQVVDG